MPVFFGKGSELYVPFTISDRFLEESEWRPTLLPRRRNIVHSRSRNNFELLRHAIETHAGIIMSVSTPSYSLPRAADKILQLYIYKMDGQRVETFPRREWANITYPHSVHVDKVGELWLLCCVHN